MLLRVNHGQEGRARSGAPVNLIVGLQRSITFGLFASLPVSIVPAESPATKSASSRSARRPTLKQTSPSEKSKNCLGTPQVNGKICDSCPCAHRGRHSAYRAWPCSARRATVGFEGVNLAPSRAGYTGMVQGTGSRRPNAHSFCWHA